MDDTQQVGQFHGAALWRGTPESYVNLHPAGFASSGIAGVKGNLQVGGVGLTSNDGYAGLWRGSPESFVILHPPGAVRSGAVATDGILQGGTVNWGATDHAAIWNGTPQSVVDLSPNGLTSYVEGMAPGVQVGRVYVPGSVHAAVWHGTPPSFLDFNPPGGATFLLATTGRFHVGQGTLGGGGAAHAIINFGAPSSWLDLHQFLTPQYASFSAANAVYQDGPTIYVGGYAESSSLGDNEAILWIGSDPCYPNCDQSTVPPALNVLDFVCFLNKFAAGDGYANCDRSTAPPMVFILDFVCFLNRFAAGCS